VTEAAEAALAGDHSVSAIDVFGRIGWLYPGAVGEWQQGRHDCLEAAMQVKPERIAEALTLLQSWAAAKKLTATETRHLARDPQRRELRCSASGDPARERLYRTIWLADLPARRRERVVAKANRAPELVVVRPLNKDWTCHRCGGTGDLLIMEKQGPACLPCAGLGDLEFLPAGDALLTRRVKAKSARHAVVVRFSRARRRYERRGLLVEPQALAQVRRELE